MARWWLIVFLLFSHAASASWQASLPDAQVVGVGDLRVFGFRVYTARLFSPDKPLKAGQPLALELTYHRTISREDLVEASIVEIKRTSGTAVTETQLVDWRKQMAKAFVDVQEGVKITGVYFPDREARFYVGERLQHVVQDPKFAKAFFDIWLSPKTRNPELRKQLLDAAGTE